MNDNAKIASKVIAERMKRILPEIIHNNQSGYIPGRNIVENIRSILDIMDYTKAKNIPGLLLFIDFEKAFDSLDWVFLEKSLEQFNFGPDLIRWVRVFYSDIQSCIINNGLCSDYFSLHHGVRQGDPLSPYLFVVAVEILAIDIRNQENIKGIKIKVLETKVLQFADDTTTVISDLESARALFLLLERFEKASGLKLNITKTEAMWIGSLQNCQEEHVGVKWKKCVKFLGIFITYDVQLLVEYNFKQRLKKIKNTINLWKLRGLSIHGKISIIKAILLPKLLYQSSVLYTPPEIIKEFNSLVFHFLWNGKDKVTRRSTYAPYSQGGLKMIDFESMIKALRLSWLKRITDKDCSGFWKCYLDYLLSRQGGLFLFQCIYDINQISIPVTFYQELLTWWSNLRESEDPDNIYKFIIWNNKEIKVNGQSVFFKHYFDMDIKYTNDLLYNMSNIESFNVIREAGLFKSNFLEWTGLRLAVPPSLRVYELNSKDIFDLETFKCHNYDCHLIRHKYEKPNKWPKLKEEFNLTEETVSEAFLLPIRVTYEPYLQSFQYKVLHSILYTNDLLYKIKYVSSPLCSLCQQTTETMSHIFLDCIFSKSFRNEVMEKILKKLSHCRCLSLSYQDIIIGVLKEIDLFNYIIILRKSYLWSCRNKKTKPTFSHFKAILSIKYETEKYIHEKSNSMNFFMRKWKMFEEQNLSN